MPFINMLIKEGAPNDRIELCMKNITSAIAENLDKTLTRMVRVTVMEIPEQYWLIGDGRPKSLQPTLTLDIGPGRSEESIQRTMHAVVDTIAETLEVPKEDINFAIIQTPNEDFTIGGQIK